MTQLITSKTQELTTVASELPLEKVEELLDFAYYLRQRYTEQPKRGSAAAILQALDEVGPLQFAEGELEARLEELQEMRLLGMDDNG